VLTVELQVEESITVGGREVTLSRTTSDGFAVLTYRGVDGAERTRPLEHIPPGEHARDGWFVLQESPLIRLALSRNSEPRQTRAKSTVDADDCVDIDLED